MLAIFLCFLVAETIGCSPISFFLGIKSQFLATHMVSQDKKKKFFCKPSLQLDRVINNGGQYDFQKENVLKRRRVPVSSFLTSFYLLEFRYDGWTSIVISDQEEKAAC